MTSSKRKTISPGASNALTFAAIFTSFCALGVSIYQSVILRNQQYAAVWPYVEPYVEYSNQTFKLMIQNKGTGPAVIKDLKLTLDGKQVSDSQQFFKDLLRVERFSFMSVSSPKNSVLAVGEKVVWLNAEVGDSLVIENPDFPQRAKLEICFCSIFGDCWRYVDGEVERESNCD